MRSEINQHRVEAIKTKRTERIRRLRSSSRCSRKDIWPPSSSSLGRLIVRALRRDDIKVIADYSQSRLRKGSEWTAVSLVPTFSADPETGTNEGLCRGITF